MILVLIHIAFQKNDTNLYIWLHRVLTEDQYASNLPTDSTDSSETEVGEEVMDLNEDELSVPMTIIETKSAPIQKNSKPHLGNYIFFRAIDFRKTRFYYESCHRNF